MGMEQMTLVPLGEALKRLDVFDHVDRDEDDNPIPGSNQLLVHTFVQSGPMLLGADWSFEDVAELLKERPCYEAGANAQRMRHGLVVDRGDQRALFLATKEGTRDAGEELAGTHDN